jgi:hypothetical protein
MLSHLGEPRQSPRDVSRREGAEVRSHLAHAYPVHGQAELRREPHHHTALGAAVELLDSEA